MKKVAGAINPTSEPDPRYDPDDDSENLDAHEWGDETEETPESDERVEEIQDIVRRSIEIAMDHYSESIEPDQTEATDYYFGRPFGDEQDGRSKVVSTDVRDATLAQMPSLLRVFFSPERAVEFTPRGPEDEALAQQQTDYINYIISNDNDGFLTFDSWFKDALVRRLGWVKWWWETFSRVEATDYTGLDAAGLQVLANDPDTRNYEIVAVHETPDGELYDCRVVRKESDGVARFEAIPPEEVVYTPAARSMRHAGLVAHVREVAREELVELGIDEDIISEAEGKTRKSSNTELEDARQAHGDGWDTSDEEPLDKSQKKVLFAEAYCLIDGDDDGIAELRLFQCVGPEFLIANGDGLGEVVDEVPFAPLTPTPEPHAIAGLSNFDLLKDVQRVKSQVERGMLDSLAQTLEPVTEIVEGQVNMADLLSPDAAKIVRVRQPGMMREVRHEFLGGAALPMLAYQDEKKESRTGHTKAAAGLDADALQSSTKAAVAATISASQQRLEYIAKVFAETGVKALMKGLYRLVVKNQNRERMAKLRGEWVPVDPRHWDAARDVTVNVGLGQGTPEDRLGALAMIVGAQSQAMQVGSPLVSWVEIRNAVAKAAELAGFRNPDMFWKPWGPEQQAEMDKAMSQKQPPPDPQMLLVQIEAQRVKNEEQNNAAKLELERWKAEREDDREREKLARDAALREYEIELKHKTQIADAEMKAKVAADRQAMDQREAA